MLLDKILSVTNAELDAIDMSFYRNKYSKSHSPEFSQYFDWKSGADHYRLLTYISNTLNGNTILDIGTFNGWSSIALATNKNNRVISFDVLQQHCVASIQESNIEYRVQNILDDSTNEELILCCPFILLDTYHDGTFENEFLHRVVSIGYKGLVMFDDIYLNDSMKSFWNNISLPKHDVTNIGHASGSGIVVFE